MRWILNFAAWYNTQDNTPPVGWILNFAADLIFSETRGGTQNETGGFGRCCWCSLTSSSSSIYCCSSSVLSLWTIGGRVRVGSLLRIAAALPVLRSPADLLADLIGTTGIDWSINSYGLVGVTCRVAWSVANLWCVFNNFREFFVLPPFSACDTRGISSEPHPEWKACIILLAKLTNYKL